jgi:hypothetical protein
MIHTLKVIIRYTTGKTVVLTEDSSLDQLIIPIMSYGTLDQDTKAAALKLAEVGLRKKGPGWGCVRYQNLGTNTLALIGLTRDNNFVYWHEGKSKDMFDQPSVYEILAAARQTYMKLSLQSLEQFHYDRNGGADQTVICNAFDLKVAA